MPYTPALRSPPVKEVRVQVDEGGTKKARGTRISSSSINTHSSSNSNSITSTATQCETVAKRGELGQGAQLAINGAGMTRRAGTFPLAQNHLGRGDRFRDGLGTYQPTAGSYATDAPGAGENSAWLGSPRYTKGNKGALLRVQPAGSLRHSVPVYPRSHERSNPFCCSATPLLHVLRW